MIDVTGFWSDVRGLGALAIESARLLPPAFLLAFAAMPAAALLCRSPTAAAIALLTGLLALFALRIEAGPVYAWGMVAIAGLSGLLAVILAFSVRRAKRDARLAVSEARTARQELDAVREKLEREIHWRQAGEKLAERKPAAVS
ncbi:hypothetical protein [Microvirga pudoricolor]|uniref:hypothetical protein n=1 Tax=Microvirga pudoricolor TaxID=2778729 RepID=UPI00194FCAB0|nr:hypothetical protein [Microvirga pudoricolor]MBM6595448.1 hypothetical protein [Microvirga pudoricolor]